MSREMSESIQQLHHAAGAEMMVFGPADGGGDGGEPITIAEHFGAYEAEYASIRQRVGIMHLPQRGLLDLRGSDVKDFLHRLLAQDINPLRGGASVRSFLLSDKGRVVADLGVHHGDENTWLEADVFDLPAVAQLLDDKLFAEDVAVEDWSDRRVCFALHGPASVALLEPLCADGDDPNAPANLPGTHHVLRLGGAACTVTRRDECGVMGLTVFVPREHAAAVYQALLDAAGFELGAPDPKQDPDAAADAALRRRQSLRGRPIGWQAYNTARIEAGTPVFHIDFGPDSLPAEVGEALFNEAVSLTKGCYVGQEIVARMKNLGHPKRVLVGFRAAGQELPVAGSQVVPADGDTSRIIGGVTSSTFSALLGHQAIGFAVVKWGHHEPGTAVRIPAGGSLVTAEITGLRHLPD
jgi:folate-binding protein YgfZ